MKTKLHISDLGSPRNQAEFQARIELFRKYSLKEFEAQCRQLHDKAKEDNGLFSEKAAYNLGILLTVRFADHPDSFQIFTDWIPSQADSPRPLKYWSRKRKAAEAKP